MLKKLQTFMIGRADAQAKLVKMQKENGIRQTCRFKAQMQKMKQEKENKSKLR